MFGKYLVIVLLVTSLQGGLSEESKDVPPSDDSKPPSDDSNQSSDVSSLSVEESQTSINISESYVLQDYHQEITSAPYVVSLKLNIGGYYRHYCDGTLLKSDLALSAAVCFETKALSHLRIYAGETYNSKLLIYSEIEWVRMHEKFIHENAEIVWFNIAIVKLQNPFSLGHSINVIEMAGKSPPKYSRCELSGWGPHRLGGKISDKLKLVPLLFIDKWDCSDQFRKVTGHILGPSIVCGGFTWDRRAVCFGDNGGPYVCNNTLVGLAIGHPMCERKPDYHHAFVEIAEIDEWVYENQNLDNGSIQVTPSFMFMYLLSMTIWFLNM